MYALKMRLKVIAILYKAIFIIFSVFIAILDLKTGMVPRIAFILALPLFFVLGLLQENYSLVMMIAGFLLGLIVFLLAFFVSGRKLGLADVWYSAIIGLALGPVWWYAAIGCACVVGVLYMLISKRRKIPFIPFMALGSVIVSILDTI